MVAAIILDPEARSVVLDADSTSGSLVEPILKVTRFMRAMEFQTNTRSGERIRLFQLEPKIGQEAHRQVCRIMLLVSSISPPQTNILCSVSCYSAPSVFNFFRPGMLLISSFNFAILQ